MEVTICVLTFEDLTSAQKKMLYLSGFSIIAEPLYKLCRKGVQFDWQREQQLAFEELKHRLVSAPVLAYPDFSSNASSFILDVDASQQFGIGAVLSQLELDGAE